MPEITLSLPAVLGFLALFFIVGAALIYFSMFNKQNSPAAAAASRTPTITLTPTETITPTITLTGTPLPTPTPLPPVEYTVKSNDTCLLIAATFNVSVNSIILANDLPASCLLSPGQKLKIPVPTPTASPLPTNTQSPADATQAACQTVSYTVAANDTLSSISANYNVTMDAIRSYNGLTGDTVYEGQSLTIPLCERKATAGPTPTATNPPPYAAPNLLLPNDGASFTLADDVVTLQWASVGTLRPDETYAVTIEDVTDSNARKLVDYVTDTKYIIPSTFRPTDNTPHIMRWWVMPVRQQGTNANGQPNWQPAGDPSDQRVFSWIGVATGGSTGATVTPNPAPTSATTSTPEPTPTP